MKIYDVAEFPNPARVRMALAEKGATDKVEFVPVDVLGGEHRGDAFLSINPDGTVPAAVLECGTSIGRCSAIIEYIDGTFDGPSLIGDTPKQRALTQMMTLRIEEGLVDAVGHYFHHATQGLPTDLPENQIKPGVRSKSCAPWRLCAILTRC